MDVTLAFDTSCYTTSVAAVDEQGQVVASHRMLLPVESGKRGLRQSEAVFAHVRQIPQVMEKVTATLARENGRICAVAAANAPREDMESYMPVFMTGVGHASVLAGALGIPCYSFSHQQGHIAAGQIGTNELGERFVALHISGGTTDLLLSERGRLTQLGGSMDLHAGQLVDRIGVAMGLPFPAGPALEKLALSAEDRPKSILPVCLEGEDLRCHLSGAEAQCLRLLEKGELARELIALEVFDFLARTIARLLAAGCAREKIEEVLVVGGVASSMLLRELVKARVKKLRSVARVVFGRPEYSADNAAGIAVLGMQRYLESSFATKASTVEGR